MPAVSVKLIRGARREPVTGQTQAKLGIGRQELA